MNRQFHTAQSKNMPLAANEVFQGQQSKVGAQ
jgi:hypothetical protein